MKHHILLVEDDETLCETLQFNLEIEGYDADVAYSAEDALKMSLESYDLILLDVMMGEISGFKFAQMLKADTKTANVPVIFCTARDSEDDMVAGFNIGADDYIYKPYTIRNLLTRIKAVLRRVDNSSNQHLNNSAVAAEGVQIDTQLKRCLVDGRDAGLVKKEFEILSLLLSNQGRVFSREEILQRVWKGEVVVTDRTVDVNITRIRHKINPYGTHIITRPGYGYGWL